MNVTGLLAGDRYVEYVGSMHFRDEKNGLRCDVTFAPTEGGWGGWFSRKVVPSDYFRGTLIRLSDMQPLDPSLINKIANANEDIQDAEVICDVQGSWLGCIEFDDERPWGIHDEFKVYSAVAVEEPLPSDCRFREDLQWLAAKDLDKSQEWKGILEEKQRAEARLRVEGANKRKKEGPSQRTPRIFRKPASRPTRKEEGEADHQSQHQKKKGEET